MTDLPSGRDRSIRGHQGKKNTAPTGQLELHPASPVVLLEKLLGWLLGAYWLRDLQNRCADRQQCDAGDVADVQTISKDWARSGVTFQDAEAAAWDYNSSGHTLSTNLGPLRSFLAHARPRKTSAAVMTNDYDVDGTLVRPYAVDNGGNGAAAFCNDMDALTLERMETAMFL